MLARFAELTGEQEPSAVTFAQGLAAREWRSAFDARDWDRLGRLYASDVILRDHRTGIRNETRGREQVLATLAEAIPINGFVRRWEPLALHSERVLAFTHVIGGETDEGGPWEMVHDQVAVTDADERVALIEIFEDRAGLAERAAELVAEPLPPLVHRAVLRSDAHRELEPLEAVSERVALYRGADGGLVVVEAGEDGELTATPFGEEQLGEAQVHADALAARDPLVLAPWVGEDETTATMREWVHAFNQHDLANIQARQSPDLRTVDHRPGIRHTIEGDGESADIWAWLFETVPDVRLEALVLQGAPGALHVRFSYTSRAAAYEIAMEIVTQTRDGVGVSTDIYEPGDPAAAERFAELTRDEPLTAILARRWERSFNARDWDRAVLDQSPAYVSDDRRPLGGGRVEGGAEGIASSLAMLEVSPDIRWHFEPIEAGDDAGLFRTTVDGHGADGGPYSVTTLQVVTAGRDRKTARNVVFDLDQEAEAWAEYRAWAAHLRQARAQEELMNGGDFDRMRAEMYAPGFTQTDFRAAGSPVLDADAMVSSLRDAFGLAPDTRVETEVIAVAGDRRVQRLTFRGHLDAGGGEVELELWTHTWIAGMRNARSDIYPSREAAEAALDAEHEPRVVAVAREWERTFNARDWAAMADLQTPDVAIDDRRAMLTDTLLGARGTGAQAKALLGVLPDAAWRYETVETLGEDAGIFRLTISGHSPDGGEAALTMLETVELDPAGRIACFVVFDENALDKARAYMAARGEHPLATIGRERAEAVAARDLDRLGALLADDYEWVGHQAGSREHLHGRDAGKRSMGEILAPAVSDVRLEWELLETAGDRRGLVRERWIGTYQGGPFEAGFLCVRELDDGGLTRRDDAFGIDDLEAARGCLVPRSRGQRVAELLHARDWDALDAMHRATTVVDRRPARGWTGTGIEAIAAFRGLVEMAPDSRWEVEVLDQPDEGLELVRWTWTGTSDGAEVSDVTLQVARSDRAGNVLRIEAFDPEQEAEARAALERLSQTAEPPVLACALAAARAFNARDWDAMGALTSPDLVNVDHRPFGAGVQLGHAGQARAVADTVPDARWQFELVELLGPDAGILRVLTTGGSEDAPVEAETVLVMRIDAQGRFVRGDTFEDEASARAWLATSPASS
jgi:ketosteroid isomerase-like protein